MEKLRKFKDWVSESDKPEDEDFFFPLDADMKYINTHCSSLSEMVKPGLTKCVDYGSTKTAHIIEINADSLHKYVKMLDSIDVEMIHDVININDTKIRIMHSKNPEDLCKYSIDEVKSAFILFNVTLRAKS